MLFDGWVSLKDGHRNGPLSDSGAPIIGKPDQYVVRSGLQETVDERREKGGRVKVGKERKNGLRCGGGRVQGREVGLEGGKRDFW